CYSRLEQHFLRTPYWCGSCPKCVFLFACFAAYLPKKEVVSMFGKNLYARRRLTSFIKRILGVEGFKPLDCVGEPEEMILAMHYADVRNEYSKTPAMRVFRTYFPAEYDFSQIELKLLSNKNTHTA
ncbi:hypothetical protein KKH15_02160, partial [Patescibacteria group bacterium]|nr:hypothetical protein [Patescibacteria group bacterium]MBU1754909.1 hypothetical protein [Patescibacteria group bacterium]